MSDLELSSWTVGFEDKAILSNLSLKARGGRLTAVVGESGTGKSTLLRSLIGLTPMAYGHAQLPGGEAISLPPPRDLAREAFDFRALNRQVGYLPQGYALLPHLTCLDNVMLALTTVAKWSRTDARQRARELFEKLGVAEIENTKPWAVSGGQRQRVALARAVAARAKLLLLDEPTSALDVGSIRLMATALRAEVHASGAAVLVASHNLGFVRSYCDDVVVLRAGLATPAQPTSAVDWESLLGELV